MDKWGQSSVGGAPDLGWQFWGARAPPPPPRPHSWLRACFHNLAHISGKKTDRIVMKILPYMYLWTTKSPLNCGSYSYPDPDSDSPCALRMLPLIFGVDWIKTDELIIMRRWWWWWWWWWYVCVSLFWFAIIVWPMNSCNDSYYAVPPYL